MSLYPYAMAALDDVVTVLRAVAEPTRVRVLRLLQQGELTVSDICAITGHSQPRISRHLRILIDAGLLSRHREGSWVYYHRAPQIPAAVLALVDGIDDSDHQMSADAARLDAERHRRRREADEHFSRLAPSWDRERSRITPDAGVESRLLDIVMASNITRDAVVDLGTGTGRILSLLTPLATRAVGIDSNHTMLRHARTAVERTDGAAIELRQADVAATGLPDHTFDLAVAHQLLHFLDSPDMALREAARILKPGGTLIIVDLLAHQDETLRTEHAHRRLGFTSEQIERWCDGVGFDGLTEHRIDHSAGDLLPVCIWQATTTTGNQ